VALNCGSMLREAARHEKVARRILFSPHIWAFFDTYVHLPNFDVASDSFATLRDLLTKHKAVAADFLEKEYEQVFTKYRSLLASDNYVTRRMSLKMLGEILLDRSNFNVM
jgi:calcium binding protein 39